MPTPFSHPNYRANMDRCGAFEPCVLCGKGVKNTDAPRARVTGGGNAFAAADEAASDDLGPGDMGWFPVGPDCAKKLRAAGVHMVAGLPKLRKD